MTMRAGEEKKKKREKGETCDQASAVLGPHVLAV
jgi:hypothetical protein